MKKVLIVIGSISLFISLIILYNISFWLFKGDPKIPTLESYWWGGYYQTEKFDKQWCIARFKKTSNGNINMALISSWRHPDVYTVNRSSSGGTFGGWYRQKS